MTETTIDHVVLDKILSAAVDRGASDVHLKAGRPPIVRFDGEPALPGFSPLAAPAAGGRASHGRLRTLALEAF